jgi:hypothetical protein
MSKEMMAPGFKLTQDLVIGNDKVFLQILAALADSANKNSNRETFKKLDPHQNFIKNDSVGAATTEYVSGIVPLVTTINGQPVQETKTVKLGVNEITMFAFISVKNLKEDGTPKEYKDIIWDFAPATYDRELLVKETFDVFRDQLALIMNTIYCLDASNEGEYVSTLITLGDFVALDQYITERGLPKQDLNNVQREFVVSREFTLILIHLMTMVEAKINGNLKMGLEEDETFNGVSEATLETIKTIATLYPSVGQRGQNVDTTINYGSSLNTGAIHYNQAPIIKK